MDSDLHFQEKTTLKKEPLPIGNFSVPFTSQIAPLISFGQLLVEKKALLPQLSGENIRGHESKFNAIAPSFIYGIQDNISIFFFVPITFKNKLGSSKSSGIGDIFLQLEYGFYDKQYLDYKLQATILGNMTFPTGSSSKNPPTGTGSFSYFFGATYSFLSFNWYAFVSSGFNITTTHNKTKFGNSYLYQCGFARYIKKLSPKECVFDLMIEFDGTFLKKDKIKGISNPNSGGNVIFMTPSIYLASKQWILQGGVGFPILQNLNGYQDKIRYSIDYCLDVTIQF